MLTNSHAEDGQIETHRKKQGTDKISWTPPRGESVRDVYKRAKKFLEKIKSRGFLVKLDSNGSNPNTLKELINEKLVDFIAMDLKAPYNNRSPQWSAAFLCPPC